MFKERLISGIVILLGIVVLIFVGGLPLWIASMVVACIGLYELYKVAGLGNDKRTWIAYPIVVAYYLLWSRIAPAIVYITAAALLVMTIFVIAYPRIRFRGWMVIIIGIFYVGVLSSCLYLTRSSQDGLYYSWLVLLSSWGADTAAYCVGKPFGKHHPFPTLSPKKSIEGCIGGLVGAGILGAVVALIMHKSIPAAIIISIIAAVFSILGDLCASAFKRQNGAKDYGTIIPGHGGVLDRFDSMLFTGAIIYICITFLY